MCVSLPSITRSLNRIQSFQSLCEVQMNVIERAIREEEIVLLITKYLEVTSFTTGIDR